MSFLCCWLFTKNQIEFVRIANRRLFDPLLHLTYNVHMLIGHLIIKQSEHFPRSDGHPKSMNKLTLQEPAMNE